MATIELQLALEEQMLQKTAERYHSMMQSASEAGRGSETEPARKLFKMFFDDCVSVLEDVLVSNTTTRGRPSKYLSLISRVDPMYSISVALNELFNNVFEGERGVQDCFVKTGQRIEDDIKFKKFKEEHPDYYDTVINDFKTKGTTNYRHMHRVLTNKMREFNVEWNDWTAIERAKVGENVVRVILDTTPMFEVKKPPRGSRQPTRFVLSDDSTDWMQRFNKYQQFLRPLGGPCIVPPKDWESMDHGGFYSPEMQSKFPFVRSRFRSKLQHSDLSEHMACVNKLQRTGWQINPRTAHFLQWAIESGVTQLIGLPSTKPYEFPPSPVAGIAKEDFTESQHDAWMGWKRETAALHSEERKRFGTALSMWRIYSMVEEYRPYERFYFVYTCDFRGRIYPVTSGLSPQGADYSKGLLQFSEGKEIGEDGAYWLKVNGANLYGFDKATYDGRVEFIQTDLHDKILAVNRDPCSIETARFIGEADKPLQFLAFCFDYAGWYEHGDSYVSHSAVGLDGSCNGLQNFSALLRDSVGGLATNVLPSDAPRDIYGEVARVAISGLNSMDGDGRADGDKLLRLGIDRSTTKRSVMTLPYGLTKHSSGGYISQWLRKKHGQHYPEFSEYNRAKNLLNDVVWDSIGKVVKAAREGMDWLQDVASIAAKEGNPLIWRTPTGFLVHQEDVRSKVKRIDTALSGSRIQYSIREYTDKIDVSAMKNGSAPNYIHSLDASHLVKTVLETEGINSFQMIHDDFGCHACDIPELHRAIRVAFVRMYRDADLLDKFRREVQEGLDTELPAPPELGDMDIEQVLDSEYFFG